MACRGTMNTNTATACMRSRYRELINLYPLMFINHPGGFEILLDDAEMDALEVDSWRKFSAEREKNVALALATPNASPEWFRVGVVFEDAYLLILRDAVRAPDGQRSTYFRIYNRLDKGPGAAILARYCGKLILLRHHRHALRSFMCEMPRGFGGPAELAAETAVRQIREELGAEADYPIPLGDIHPDGGKLGDAVGGFLVEVNSVGRVERGEAITDYELLDGQQLTTRIANDEITDAFTLALYAKAVAKGVINLK